MVNVGVGGGMAEAYIYIVKYLDKCSVMIARCNRRGVIKGWMMW